MTNFAAIVFIDDWFDLAASLRTRMGLFKPAGDGLLTAEVRGPRPGAEDPEDAAAFAYFKAPGVRSGKWPELKIALDKIKQLGEQLGGVEFGRIGLAMLPAGASMPWWRGKTSFEHGLLLLRGNPGLVWYGGAETWMPTIGVLTLVNWRVPNSAVNMGESPAIWLAVDFRKAGEP
jgi:hypothetical protein